MKKPSVLSYLIVLIGLSCPMTTIAQPNPDTKAICVSTGLISIIQMEDYLSTYMIHPPYSMNSTIYRYALNIAPTFRLKKHEFYIGALLTERIHGEKFDPSFGGMIGYRYYFFKEPMRVNFFLHYGLQYLELGREKTYWSGGHQITEFYREDYFYDAFGFGFNLNFDKKHIFGFNTTLNYIVSLNPSGIHRTNIKWNNIEIDLGFIFRIKSFHMNEQ